MGAGGGSADDLADVWRREAPHVLGALARRYGDFDAGEDAMQEALLAAATQWPVEGLPDDPRGWLVRVASRRLVDRQRSDRARTRREQAVRAREPSDAAYAPGADADRGTADTDTLELLVLCGHPALTRASQVALTLRAVGGLTTAQIAAAFLVPEATMAQRISRAKAALRAAGARFPPVTADELPDRLAGVRHVLYLIFNEGYTASAGPNLLDVSLTREAIRMARELHRVSDDPEVAGLLALMLLTDARRPARSDPDGELVPLERQDRSRWDAAHIAEGVELLAATLPRGPVGPYQLQAAIAAIHDEATTWAGTDWLEITMLYRMLEQVAPAPVVTLNAAVAVGMAHGPEAGLAHLQPLLDRPELRRHHRLYAVRGHLLELAGHPAAAAEAYALAASLTASIPEQRYLHRRAQACSADRRHRTST